MPNKARSRKSALLDLFAISVSSVCMVHCVGLPLILLALPGLLTAFNWPEEVHVFAVCLAIPASSLAVYSRWRKLYAAQRRSIITMMVMGLSLLIGALFMREEWQETVLTVCGSVALISAHVMNMRTGVPAA